MWLAFAAQRQLALDAKKAMFSRLFASLGEAVAKPAPAGACDNANLSGTECRHRQMKPYRGSVRQASDTIVRGRTDWTLMCV